MISLHTLLACTGDKSDSAVPTLQSGSPYAGVAEGKIDIPLDLQWRVTPIAASS